MEVFSRTGIDDIYQFARKTLKRDRIVLVVGRTEIPDDTLELWDEYKQRMGYRGSIINVEENAAPEVWWGETKTMVSATVMGLDFAPLRLYVHVLLYQGENYGDNIFSRFRDHFEGKLDILAVGLRKPGVAKVLRVYNTENIYNLDNNSHFFVYTHPISTHAGGRSRVKNTSERRLSHSFRH